MTKSSNKRKKQRVGCSVPIDGKKGTPFSTSHTVDISEGGIGLISKKAVAINTQMPVEIALTPKSEPILAVGHVKWVSQLPASSEYRVGLSFDDVKSSSQSRLKKYFSK